MLALSKNKLMYWSDKGRKRKSRQSTKILKIDSDLLTTKREKNSCEVSEEFTYSQRRNLHGTQEEVTVSISQAVRYGEDLYPLVVPAEMDSCFISYLEWCTIGMTYTQEVLPEGNSIRFHLGVDTVETSGDPCP